MKNKMIVFLAVSIILLSVTHFAWAADELFEIKYPTLTYSDPVFIADELGFFKNHGIKVNFTGILPGPSIVASVSNGSNDFAGTSASFIIAAIANGFKVKAVAAGWGSSVDKPSYAWIVKKDSPYKSIKDLAGQKVGGSPRHYAWLEALDQNGLNQDDIAVVNVENDTAEQVLRQGEVAAVATLNPYLSKALRSGEFRELTSNARILGYEAGWPQQIVNLEFLEKHPDVVRNFVAAIAEACDWLRANPEKGGRIFARVFNAPAEYSSYYTAYYPEHGLVDETDAQLQLNLAIKFGDVAEGKISTADLYTNEYNPYYKK
jgi:ABC-type nitrate/sulfonate/bicarbonate transport system substrate-binding protein